MKVFFVYSLLLIFTFSCAIFQKKSPKQPFLISSRNSYLFNLASEKVKSKKPDLYKSAILDFDEIIHTEPNFSGTYNNRGIAKRMLFDIMEFMPTVLKKS
ncbi:MAG: hypothetical protein SFU98_20525 [Leptospiraceae bacterium]|nr:hypothetical protein [Leptospiraceae bacterium]